MIQFTDVLGLPRCHSWHKMKIMWLHSCHQGNGEISRVAAIYTGGMVWPGEHLLQRMKKGGWKRPVLMSQVGWRRKTKSIVLLAWSARHWIFQCRGHCHLSKHKRASCPYGGIWDWSRKISLRAQTDNALPIFMAHSCPETSTALPKGLCSLHRAGRKPHV